MVVRPHKFTEGIFEHVGVQEKINFARHLSLTIKAGLPLFEGLKVIKGQVVSKTLKKVIDQVIDDVNKGQFLSDALERHQHLFGEFFINIIRIGEASGTLASNLLYLAEEMKKSKDLRGKVRSSMIYPIIILIATFAITALLMFFVFPKILPVFTGLKIQLPITTRIMIGSVNFLLAHWLKLVIGIAVAVIGFRALIILQGFRFILHRVEFFIPVLARLIIHINMANFARVTGVLLKSGVKIVEAVTITSKTFNNLVYRRELLAAAEEIRKGGQLGAYLSKRKKFFPPLLSGLIAIGENTGNLEDNLFYLADYYEEEVDSSLRNLTALIEPLLLLVMGLIVGFVALSIVTPIYSLTQGIK